LAKFPDVGIVGIEERGTVGNLGAISGGFWAIGQLLIVSRCLLLREKYVFAQSGKVYKPVL
jgi:hypothetical protein